MVLLAPVLTFFPQIFISCELVWVLKTMSYENTNSTIYCMEGDSVIKRVICCWPKGDHLQQHPWWWWWCIDRNCERKGDRRTERKVNSSGIVILGSNIQFVCRCFDWTPSRAVGGAGGWRMVATTKCVNAPSVAPYINFAFSINSTLSPPTWADEYKETWPEFALDF